MENEHAISALKRKRAELAGDLIGLDKQRRAVCNRIHHVDEALKLMGFAGDPKAIPARIKRGWLFRRGQLQRMVYASQRKGQTENADIARAIIVQMGWDAEDDELRAFIAGKVKDVRKRLTRRSGFDASQREPIRT